jgi:hypothetical protein
MVGLAGDEQDFFPQLRWVNGFRFAGHAQGRWQHE